MSLQICDNPFCRSAKFSAKKAHLGISGSIACYKAMDLLRAFLKLEMDVSAALSAGARQFITPLLVRALGADPVYGDMFDSQAVFAHLEPGESADVMLIAPASADILAKMAAGIADDMLSAQFVAFEGPVVIAPAMNPRMWRHAATRENVSRLAERGAVIVEPGVGQTACGEEGQGRLAELPLIFLECLRALSPRDLKGLKAMVTLGPTRENWDGARFWSNPSSGKMGAALATAAWLRGAEVTAICGPCAQICLPPAIRRVDVCSASEMFEEAKKVWPQMNLGLFSAAVADFAPVRPAAGDCVKIKKSGLSEKFGIEFTRNPDILATLAADRANGQKVLGFAAEIAPDMEALLPLAQKKLESKKADLIAGNRVNRGESAFGAPDGSIAAVDRNGEREIWPPRAKADIAWDLLTWLLRI